MVGKAIGEIVQVKGSEGCAGGGAKVQVTGQVTGHRSQATGQVTGHRSHTKTNRTLDKSCS